MVFYLLRHCRRGLLFLPLAFSQLSNVNDNFTIMRPSHNFSVLKRAVSSAILLGAMLLGCTKPQAEPIHYVDAAALQKNPRRFKQTILDEARELQGVLVDGWFYGRDPRNFKTAYGVAPPEIKAQFALDYAKMLSNNAQDMEKNWRSYVPYSKREEFARQWWTMSAHSNQFIKENHWKQIIWLHEALLDAGELWWRAVEKELPDQIASSAALAHDAEQRQVDTFKENEAERERSFSEVGR